MVTLFPDKIQIVAANSIVGIILVGLVIGILNTFIKPFLKLISMPFMLLSMGLFLVFINAAILFFLEFIFTELLTPFEVSVTIVPGFSNYLMIGLVLGFTNSLLHWIFKSK